LGGIITKKGAKSHAQKGQDQGMDTLTKEETLQESNTLLSVVFQLAHHADYLLIDRSAGGKFDKKVVSSCGASFSSQHPFCLWQQPRRSGFRG
jgi:hypothetical protein